MMKNRVTVMSALLLAIVIAGVQSVHAKQGAPADNTPMTPRAVIRVKESATVQGKEILLKDLAEITSRDRALSETLAVLPVGQAPPPGLTRTFDPALIIVKLRQHRIDPAGIHIESPRQVVVAGAHRVIESGALFEAARAAVLRGREKEMERLTVRHDVLPPNLVVPPGEVELRARPRLASACPEPCRRVDLGSIPVVVEAWVDGRLYRTVSLTVRLSLVREVVVVNSPLPRHTVVKATDVRLEQRDIGPLTHEPLEDPALAIGRRTTRMLAMGDIVLSDAVELPPLIRKGDVVTLAVERPGLLVTARGVAQEAGRAGELVRVKNTASGRDILGKVETDKTISVGVD